MKLKKAFKSFASIILVLTMLMSLLPVGIFVAETNKVTIKFAAFDGKSGEFVYAPKELTVIAGIAAENGLYNAKSGHMV